MAEKKKKGALLAILGAVGILGLFGLMGAASGAEPRDPKLGPGGRGTTRPKPGPGGKGKNWGPPAGPVGGFDPSGAGLIVLDDCMTVVEGDRFWPKPMPDVRERYATGASCLITSLTMLEKAGDPRCSALDFVEYLTQEEGYDPIMIAHRILRDASPICADADPSTWGDGLFSWYNDLIDRLTDYVPEFQDFAES